MGNGPLRVAACVGALLAGCSHRFAPLDLSALPALSRHKGHDYRVLLDEQVVRYRAGDAAAGPVADVVTRRRLQLLRGTALPPFQVTYDRTFSRLVSLQARVVLPGGEVRELDEEQRSDTPASGGSVLFTDARVVRLDVPPMPPGAVLDVEAVEHLMDTLPHVTRFSFGEHRPVLVSRLVVERPSSWELDVRGANLDRGVLPAPREEVDGEVTRLVWEQRDLPAMPQEGWAPPAHELAPAVLVRPLSWEAGGERRRALGTAKALSAWLFEQYRARSEPDEAIRAQVEQVLKDVPDGPVERARALYEHACRAVQYCAIEVGYGGWIPHHARDVQRLRYGDCKDKANYLRTLLAVAGVRSDVALIYAHRGLPRRFETPALGANFNHAVLAVRLPDRTVYADPTWRSVPFGTVPGSDIGAPVLPLVEGGAELEATPEPPAAENGELQRIALTLDASGDGVGTYELEARGLDAVELRTELLGGSKKQTELLEQALGLHSLEVKSADTAGPGDFAAVARVKGALVARRVLARAAGTATLLRLSDFAPRWLPALEDEVDERRHPVVFRWLDHHEGTFTLRLPAGARVTRLPPGATVDSPFFRYTLAWRAEGEVVTVTRSLERRRRVVPADEYGALQKAIEEVLVAEATAAVVRLAREGGP